MNHWDTVISVVRAAVEGDTKKARSYVRMLAESLERAGERELAADLRNELKSGPAKALSPARAVDASAQNRVPMDPESRVAIADLEDVEVRPELVLPPFVEGSVAEFVDFARAADRFAAQGLTGSNTLLMSGPPGTGKTETARRIAFDLQLPLLIARSDTLISSFLGATSKNLRQLFSFAALRPCVLFLDEFDALAKMRDDQHELGELKRVVVALLQNVDALPTNVTLLAATNHSHLLDPAVGRRFEFRVEFVAPDQDQRARILRQYMAGVLTDREFTALAKASEGLSGAALKTACENARRLAIVENRSPTANDVGLRLLTERFGSGGGGPADWLQNRRNELEGLSVRDIAIVTGLSVGAAHKKTSGRAQS